MYATQIKYGSLCGVAVVVGTLLMAVGCSSTSAHRIDPTGTDTVVTQNSIDIQDWADASQKMTDSLLASGVLQQTTDSSTKPVVLAVSRIKNNTTEVIDTSLLTQTLMDNLRTASKGRVLPTMTIGLGGAAQDPLAKGELQRKEFLADGEKGAAKELRPRFTLSGSIIEKRARAGSTRQTSYIFQLNLTDTDNGTAPWGDQQTITKQGQKAGLGW